MNKRVLQMIGRTAWIIPAIIGLGALTWASFLYPGIKMRNRLWLIAAAIYAALGIAVIAAVATAPPSADPVEAAEGSTELSAWGGGVVVVTWLSGMVVFTVLLPMWIKWRRVEANTRRPQVFVDQESVAPVSLAQVTDTSSLRSPQTPGDETPMIQTSDVLAGSDQRVDANSASAQQLNDIAGMPAGHGYVIVNERSTQGPFADLADFLRRVPLDPHVAAKVKGSLSFGPNTAAPRVGRIVDF